MSTLVLCTLSCWEYCCSKTSELNPKERKKNRDKFKIITTFCFFKKTKKTVNVFFLKRRKTMYPHVEDLIGFFTEDEEDCCCCCFCCCCCSLSYVKETVGGEGISPVILLPLVDGPSTPPQTAPCVESATSSLLFHKE